MDSAAAPAGTGQRRGPLSPRQLRRVRRAVHLAERETGLQIGVYLGPTPVDLRGQARARLGELGHPEPPAVLLLVAPEHRVFDLVVAPAARDRVAERALSLVGASVSASFALGDVAGGICTGLEMLAQYAGPPANARRQSELPDLIDGYGPA